MREWGKTQRDCRDPSTAARKRRGPPVGMTNAERGERWLARGPVGRFLVPGVCELVRLRAVGEHGPDLPGAAARGFEDDVTAIGSPTGAFIAPGIASEFADLAGGHVHDVDIVIAAGA